jgi:hypothetical protein
MVVKIRRLLCVGRRSWIFSRSWEIVVLDGTGSERVDGRFRPGKEVKKTLIVDGAMVGQ